MAVFTDYKRVGYTIATLVLTALTAQAQPEAQVTSGNLFNAGKLATDAAPVPVRWELVNGGTEPLLLGEGVSTDDGLRGRWPRTAIAPGQRFAIEGTFDPKNHRRGNFVSQLQIESNARTGRVLLTAFGLAHAPGENPYYYATAGNGATIPGKWGYIDHTGQYVVQPQFDWAGEFRNGLATFKKDELWGYIDRTGRVVVPAVFKVNDHYENGCGRVTLVSSGKEGLLDTEGRWLLPPTHQKCGPAFYQGRVAVRDAGRWYVVDRKNQEVPLPLNPAITFLSLRPDGTMSFEKNKKYGLLNPDGRELLPPLYKSMGSELANGARAWSGMTVVTRDGKDGAIDAQGRLVVPCKYIKLSYFAEGRAIGTVAEGSHELIDTQGKVIQKLKGYEDAGFYFSEGRAVVLRNNQRGYIDGAGNEVVAPQFNSYVYYHEGLAYAGSGQQQGYIDRAGRVVIAGPFADANNFAEGLAAVKGDPARPASALPPDPDVLRPAADARSSTFDATRPPDETNGLPLAPTTEALAVPDGARPAAEIAALAGPGPYAAAAAAAAAAAPPVARAAPAKEAAPAVADAPIVPAPAAPEVPAAPAAVAPPVPAAPAAALLVTWTGRVLDAQTKQPLPTAVVSVSAVSGSPTAVGSFSYPLPVGAAFTYDARLVGYVPANGTLTLPAAGLRQDILLEPLKVGATVKLDNINFTKGLFDLLPASFAALDKLVQLMQQYPAMTIELRGHTDNTGDAQNPRPNQVLSEQRVAEVKKYLAAHGIAEGRIGGKGFGGSLPIASNSQEFTRKLNRRVEFKITRLE